MQTIFTRKDALNLVILLLYSYLLLGLIGDPNILTYERASQLEMNKEKMQEAMNVSVFIGLIFLFLLYFIARVVFKQGELPVFVSSILTISSYAFINNFSLGISDFTYLLYGGITIPSFSFEKVYQIIPLLPLALLSMYSLYSNKKFKYLFTAIMAIIVSGFIPILSLPFLFILNSDGFSKINRIKDNSISSTITGGMIALAIAAIILGYNSSSIAVSIIIGTVMAVAILAFENKHTILYLLIVTLVMISIIYGVSHIISNPTVDSDTISAIKWMSEVNGKVAFASFYGKEIENIAFVETGKKPLTEEAFVFLFTNRTRIDFDYLIIDTLILDRPKEYAKLANLTANFDTFIYSYTQVNDNIYYRIYLTHKRDYLIIYTDATGNVISNRVIINGAEESYFKLILLNSSDPIYSRYIHPRSDINKNIFKLFYPEQFGGISGYDIKEIKTSNNSRFRMYQIIKVD